jgi:hypothetical protein
MSGFLFQEKIMPRTTVAQRGGSSRVDFNKANRNPAKVVAENGPSPFLDMPWQPDWDADFTAWSEQFSAPQSLTDLIMNRIDEHFDLSLKERNTRYYATLINQDVEDGTGPKLLSAFSLDPREAILLVYYKFRVLLMGVWPEEQTENIRPTRG